MLWFLLSFLLSVSYVFCEAGCSFRSSGCLYNVKVGRHGGCDVTSAKETADQATCCGQLNVDVKNLQNEINTYAKTISGMDDAIQTSTSQGSQTTSAQTANEQHLLDILAQKEATLKASQALLAQKKLVLVSVTSDLMKKQQTVNQSKEILSHVTAQSLEEVRRMKVKLSNVTRDLNNCKGVLALKHSNSTFSQGPHPAYNMTYCPFEDIHKFCFTQDKGDSDEWYQMSGSPSTSTGPKEDHTYGNPKGHYMLMNPSRSATSSKPQEKVVRMTSEIFPPAPNYCIRFWYNMYGADVHTLNVYAKVGKGYGYPVWTSSGNHGHDWHLGEVGVDWEYTRHGFRVVFEANHEAYYTSRYNSITHRHESVKVGVNGDVAIDDVYIYDIECKSIPTCPPEATIWKGNGSSSCYTFHTTPDGWYQSYLTCREEGPNSHLVSINSQEEQDFLISTITSDASLSAAGSFGWYTSGNDERSEHNFEWTDTGTPYKIQYTDWHKDQPNNVANNQDCLLMQYADDGYRWGDVSCSDKHPFICEVDLPTI